MNLSNRFLIKWMDSGSQSAKFVDADSLEHVIDQVMSMAQELKTSVEIHRAAKMLGVVKEIQPGKFRFEPCMENWSA